MQKDVVRFIIFLYFSLLKFCGNYAVIFYAVDVFSGIDIKHVVMHMMDHDQYTPETGNPDINSTYKSYEGIVLSIYF